MPSTGYPALQYLQSGRVRKFETRSVRLDRAQLESEGKASTRTGGYQTFYTTAAMERMVAKDRDAANDARHRSVLAELEVGRLQMEMGARLDFHEVAPGIVKMGDAPIYAHDAKTEACSHCDGKGKVGRLKCHQCFGKGKCRSIDNYFDRNKIRFPSWITTAVRDLDELRSMVAQCSFESEDGVIKGGIAVSAADLTGLKHSRAC
jgi:hypothetical protein